MKRIVFITVALLVVVSAGLFLKKQKQNVETLPSAKEYAKSVDVVMPYNGKIAQDREFLAQVLSSKSANIATKFAARIKKVYVEENDKVKQGDLLISLDDAEILATLASLKEQEKSLIIDVTNAKNIFTRNAKLYDIEAISKEAFDTSKAIYHTKLAALSATKEKINQTKAQLQYLNIRAPFSGVVGSKFLDAGSLAPAGKVILTLNSDDQKLNFSFSQNAKPIAEGQKVFVDAKEIGQVTKIYDDAKNALLVAEVKPYHPLAYANKSYITIAVEVDSVQSCIIPVDALLHKKDATYVMLYKEGIFQKQKVDVVLQNDHNAAIAQCPNYPVAVGSEAKLATLGTYGKVVVDGAYNNEK